MNRFTPPELSKLFSLLSFQEIYATIIYPRLALTKWIRDLAISFYQVFRKKNCPALIFNLRCFLSKPKVSLIILKKSAARAQPFARKPMEEMEKEIREELKKAEAEATNQQKKGGLQQD